MGNFTRSFLPPVHKSAPVNLSGRVASAGNISNDTQDEAYLRYYKSVSWVRAAIAVIAQGIAQTTWRTYQYSKNGTEREELPNHELTKLLRRPNQFHSGYDFFYSHTIFDELLGRNYWVKQKDLGDKELWLFPPQKMSPVPDKSNTNNRYILGYEYRNGQQVKTFKPDEVIMFLDPDPLNEMGGAGRAQSVGLDIENQSYMSQYNRNYFMWGAESGTVISYPPEAQISPAELDKLLDQWNAGHRGYGRAYRAAILTQGATVSNTSPGQKDMDWSGLAKYNRESILGVFGVSYSMVGGTENVIRANAEAQLFNFAQWVLKPRLTRIREKINMFLVDDFGKNLGVDFDDPAPENEESDTNKSTRLYQGGIATLNEARSMVDLPPDETEAGDQYYKAPQPQSPFGGLFNQPEQKPKEDDGAKEGKAVRKSFSESESSAFHAAYHKRVQSYEPEALTAIRGIFEAQKTEVLKRLESVVARDTPLIDIKEAREQYAAAMEPVLTSIILRSMQAGAALVEPKNPHKAEGLIQVINQFALNWLKTRIAWAAQETTEETAKRLSDILWHGFERGQSIPQISQTITEEFDGYFSQVRAVRICRTEVLAASNIGNIEGYKEAGIEKTRSYAAEDERTCPLCGTLHDTVHPITDGFVPPYHVNCRCVALPELSE